MITPPAAAPIIAGSVVTVFIKVIAVIFAFLLFPAQLEQELIQAGKKSP